MTLDIRKLNEILARTNKNTTPEELDMLKSWFETNEGLMNYKRENNIVDSKRHEMQFSTFHMDIYDVIIHNDPNYKK